MIRATALLTGRVPFYRPHSFSVPFYWPHTYLQAVYRFTGRIPIYRPYTCLHAAYLFTGRILFYKPYTVLQAAYRFTGRTPFYRPHTYFQAVYLFTGRMPRVPCCSAPWRLCIQYTKVRTPVQSDHKVADNRKITPTAAGARDSQLQTIANATLIIIIYL